MNAPTPTRTLADTGGVVVTDDGRPVAVIDRKLGLFSYGGGAVVSMDQVRFARKLQIGSSSPKLVALTPAAPTSSSVVTHC
jgi:hypothetical protein